MFLFVFFLPKLYIIKVIMASGNAVGILLEPCICAVWLHDMFQSPNLGRLVFEVL